MNFIVKVLALEDGKAFEAPVWWDQKYEMNWGFMSRCDAVLLSEWLLMFQRFVVLSCWRFCLNSPVIFLATLETPHPTTHHHISEYVHPQQQNNEHHMSVINMKVSFFLFFLTSAYKLYIVSLHEPV